MNKKRVVRQLTDLLMTLGLLCLMAFQVTGDALHEWIGVTVLLLFVAHNLLNIKFYTALFQGKYKPLRIFRTVINAGVLAAMLCLGFSGTVLSRYAFAPFSINGPMATARSMHLAASYWGFVLMGLHLGLHWGMVIGMAKAIRKGKKPLPAGAWCARLLAAIISAYGLYSFIKADIPSYMFLKNPFVFFDFEKPAFAVFAEYIAMMSFFVFTAYYTAKGIGMIKNSKGAVKQHEKES